MRPRSIALACAAAAFVVCGLAAGSVIAERGSVTALVRMSGSEPMATLAREVDPSFAFVDPQAHYDGVYFYAMARDPLARGEAHELIDRAAYRYGHVGYAWLAWLASGGQPGAVPGALLAVSLLGAAAGGFAASLVAREFGWSGWWGLLVALSPGLVFAVTVDTSEPVAFALLALGVLAWTRRRWLPAGACFAAMCLTKEPLLLVPVGLVVWEAVEWWRKRDTRDLLPRLVALAAGPAVFLLWYAYLRATFGIFPFLQEAKDYFSFPATGWWDSMRKAAALSATPFFPNQVGNAALPLLAVCGAAIALGLVRAARFRHFIHPVFILMALMILSLNHVGVLYPKDLFREAAITLLLLPPAIAMGRTSKGLPSVH